MLDSVSATCACGAQFGANSRKATALWREWKLDHTCPTEPDQHSTLGVDSELAPDDEPEFSIGFSYQETDE